MESGYSGSHGLSTSDVRWAVRSAVGRFGMQTTRAPSDQRAGERATGTDQHLPTDRLPAPLRPLLLLSPPLFEPPLLVPLPLLVLALLPLPLLRFDDWLSLAWAFSAAAKCFSSAGKVFVTNAATSASASDVCFLNFAISVRWSLTMSAM